MLFFQAEKDLQELLEKNKRLKSQNDKLEKQLHEAKAALNEMAHHGESAESLKVIGLCFA